MESIFNFYLSHQIIFVVLGVFDGGDYCSFLKFDAVFCGFFNIPLDLFNVWNPQNQSVNLNTEIYSLHVFAVVLWVVQCSEVCGGGQQQRIVTCPEEDQCDRDHEPSTIQSCNSHPCAQWLTGSWGQVLRRHCWLHLKTKITRTSLSLMKHYCLRYERIMITLHRRLQNNLMSILLSWIFHTSFHTAFFCFFSWSRNP